MTGAVPRARSLAFALLAALVVLAHATLLHRATRSMPRYSDEQHHFRQIERFCGGDFTLLPKVTSIPGFHVLGMLVGRLGGDCSIERMRLLNLGLLLLATGGFFLACRAGGSAHPALRALQFYFLPVLLPYAFVVYADVISVVFNVLTAWLLLARRPRAAGSCASLAILVRQTNVGWLPLVMAWVVLEDPFWREAPSRWRALAGRLWPTLLGLAGFAGFVLWNGGVTLGARAAFGLGVYGGNVFFALALFFVLFLPGHLGRIWQERRRLAHPLLALAVAGGYLVYMATFPPDHPFNKFPGFLHNELLSALRGTFLPRSAFYVLVAGGLAALAAARLTSPALYALYPLALAGLLPLRFVEQRYAIPFLVFFLALRRDQPAWAEALDLLLSVALSSLALWVMVRGTWWL